MKGKYFSSEYMFKLLIYAAFFICYPEIVLSQSETKEICFNFNIITKKSNHDSESNIYERQKRLVLNQLSQTQLVFDKSLGRQCPEIKFSKGIIKQITWKKARRLSQPIDQNSDETIEVYLVRKLGEATAELQLITNKINEYPEINYRSLFELRPGPAIINAENALQKIMIHRETLNNNEFVNVDIYKSTIDDAITDIKLKLDSYAHEDNQEDSTVILEKAKQRIKSYEQTDQLSARTWQEGELTFWNDIEAQNTSVELKNLLRHYRSSENQCLDVYIVPSGKTPSGSNKEVHKHGKWTQRGGVAMSSKYFPRTTGGKGHAILLTYNSRISENRLAHELGHLLLDKGDAHEGKTEKDLMYENSKGGFYLDEMECDIIKRNIKSFFGGSKDYSQSVP